jgi:hypothetical protein
MPILESAKNPWCEAFHIREIFPGLRRSGFALARPVICHNVRYATLALVQFQQLAGVIP